MKGEFGIIHLSVWVSKLVIFAFEFVVKISFYDIAELSVCKVEIT